ncbi:MAG TPA: ABC transporter substrate-binding protein [Candidatus Binatia bacterium]|jgi:ABC-type nitrate/sulfonate/bicarbonate transport system substrate-binding protein|nr:ABC transporter substrate-binding protein [Candidatus Binatia bacterium]
MHRVAKISRPKLICYTLAVLSLFGVAATAPAQPVRIAVGAASVASLPTWVAHDGGYFAREGVPAELIYIRGGPQTMSALISGEVPFAQIYGGALVAAGLTGADVVIVAGLINQPFFSIITAKGIDKPEDLRGKKVGISTFGSATDFALRLALKKWGLKADSEVSILQMRGVPEILPAMASGALHGGVMSPPTNMIAIRAGFKELAYLPQIGISFQHTSLATTRRYLEKNRPTALKVMRAYHSAIERIKSDKAYTLKTLSKYMSTNDNVVLDYSYNVGQPLFRIPSYPTLEGIQAALDFLADKDPKAKQAQPKDFVDISLLQEIEKAGAKK